MIVPVEGTVTVRLMLDTETEEVSAVQIGETHAWAPPDGLAMPEGYDYAGAAHDALERLGVQA